MRSEELEMRSKKRSFGQITFPFALSYIYYNKVGMSLKRFIPIYG